MGTVPTPGTQGAGLVVASTLLNGFRDVLNFLLSPPKVFAYQLTTPTTMTTSGTIYPVGMDTEVFDVVQSGDSPSHDNASNNTRLICRTAGKYRISGQCAWASNATGVRNASIRLNAAGNPAAGTGLPGNQLAAITGGNTVVPVAPFIYPLAAGDHIELFGVQTSGGSLATALGLNNTFLLMEWAGL